LPIDESDRHIAHVRRFNRFYTQKIGVLQEGLLDSAYSLAQVRILYELAHWRGERGAGSMQPPSARRLAVRLGLDEGYLSRLLRGLEKQRLIARKPSSDDGRENVLSLTRRGRMAFAPLDARSRLQVAAMLAPLSGRRPVTARQMIENLTLTESMLELLSSMVKGRLNILVSGGTGAGKTTLLNVLSGYIPNSDRIVTIEDAAELQLKQEHVVRLETRPPNIEGKGAVRQRQLVINSLRMRPDRIVVGEVRGEEAFDMLQAMNTGHEGSRTTVHANSPRDAMARIENMVSMANLNMPERAVRHQIASAVHAVIQIARLSDGTRKVITISEITGMDSESIAMQDIFVFDRTGIDENGKVRGIFRATGTRPQFADRLATSGRACVPPCLNRRLRCRFPIWQPNSWRSRFW
jgi:type IV secretory pathway ATPase VirB11/archaellum biosynthesis ATPase